MTREANSGGYDFKAASDKRGSSALENFTVIDFTYLFPGGYCTRILADHGARVIRIERPGEVFNSTEIWPWEDDASFSVRRSMAARYLQINCNKESLVLDYTSQSGRDLLIKLARRADVLVEGFRPGVMDKYGLGYTQFHEVNPQLIYCSITGYGQKGPYSKFPSHDPNIQSMSGIVMLTQGPNGPGITGIPICDILAGSNAAMAILMALIARETGQERGQHLDVSMLDGAVWATGLTRADAYFATGHYLGPDRRPSHIFKTLDEKYICLIVVEEKFWQIICSRLGLEEYAGDWTTVQYFSEDTSRRRKIISRLSEVFKTKTRESWSKLLSDCCLTPVLDFEEVLNDANTTAHDLVIWIDDPRLGKVPSLGVPFRMSRTPGKILSLPPLKGENTDQILSELGSSGNKD